VITLGCRLNLAESDRLRGLLSGLDDLVVVNSCAVTAEAVRETRRAIRQARKARPDSRLLVTGCAAEVERTALSELPEVDGFVANARKLDPRAWNAPASTSATAANSSHTRAFVQVQNGCDHDCTFCVIPQGRGPSRSRPVADIVREITGHVARGTGEVVLTGVDLTDWGKDLPRPARLGSLVAAILRDCPGLARLRLSSLDGIEIDAELHDLIAGEPRVMPHVHLSLQSGDDLILKRMKRRHCREDALRLVDQLRARRPDLSVGADLIAGFPTEDDTMHQQSVDLIAELGVVHGHVFPYSRRPGTPAARMPQVDTGTIRERAAELRCAVAEQRRHWLNSLVGTPQRVLAERDGTGHAENFARIRLPEGTGPGEMVEIVPTRIVEGLLA